MEMTRRELLAGAAGMVAAMAAGGCATMAESRPLPKFAYVGCYTTKLRNGRGEGIGVFRIDAATGAWTQVQLAMAPDNPSWLAFDRNKRFLYVAHGDGQAVTAYRVDEATGQLSLLGSQDAKGKNGVRLGVDASNRYVICANYASGTVVVLPIQPDGSLGAATDLAALPGRTAPSSPIRSRMTSCSIRVIDTSSCPTRGWMRRSSFRWTPRAASLCRPRRLPSRAGPAPGRATRPFIRAGPITTF